MTMRQPKDKEKFLPRSHKQNILELLRDTKQTVEEISLELKCDMTYAQSAVKQLEADGLLIRINDNKPYYYTSDYDLLPIKVHQMDYDQYELVIPVSDIVVKRDPLVELFFSEPPVVPYTDKDGYTVLEVSYKQFHKIDTSLVIYPFTEDAKFIKATSNNTAYLADLLGLDFAELFGFYDCFKIIVRK